MQNQSNHEQKLSTVGSNSQKLLPNNSETSLDQNSSSNSLYFQEYLKVKGVGYQLKDKLNHFLKQRNELLQELVKLQARTERDFADNIRNIPYHKKIRIRKPQHKVNRIHQCRMGNCSKAYGTLGSLLQHQNLKHPQEYQVYKNRSKGQKSPESDEILSNS